MAASEEEGRRRLLFISYASADIALAEWLGERLSLQGYEVWLDRWHLPAGSDWSREIGRVMADETFRVIHLLSRHSLHDSYAAPERGRACDLGRERGVSLLIPLLVEPMKRTQRPIEVQSTVAIDFWDWGSGLERILLELDSIDAPRREVSALHRPTDFSSIAREGSEPLFSNAFTLEDIPPVIHHYRVAGLREHSQRAGLRAVWPHWQPYGTGDMLSFFQRPEAIPEHVHLPHQRSIVWSGESEIADQPMTAILPALLRRTFDHRCRALGLVHWSHKDRRGSRERSTDWLYFPRGLLPEDKLKVKNWSGKRVAIKVIGERTYKGQPFHAHLAFSPFFEQIEPGAFLLFLRLGVRPIAPDGTSFEPSKIGPRVKQATRSWTNADLLARMRVVTTFLADSDGEIGLGPADQPRIRLRPLNGEVTWTLDESALTRLGAEPASGEIDSGPEDP